MAGQILDSMASIETAKLRERELRLALASRTDLDYEALFPEEFGQVVEDDEAEIEEGTDLEGNATPTKYVYTGEYVPTPEEVERDIAEMMARASTGEASFEDIDLTNEWQ